MFDFHMHTAFSADSQEPIDAYLSVMNERGIEAFCVTEHMAVNFHRGDWMVKLDEYVPRMRRLKEQSIPLRVGVEADVSCAQEDVPVLVGELSRYPLDFVLASSHSLHHLDPYMEEFFAGKNPVAVCREYLQDLYFCLKRIDPKLFSALAHVDYLAKGFGAKYLPDGVFRYEYAPDEMDVLMRYAIENGKCIEINTSAIQSLTGVNPPALSWLRRYCELGGEFVTTGSDAHKADRFGSDLLLAQAVAREAGVRYVATYDQMVPTMHKL